MAVIEIAGVTKDYLDKGSVTLTRCAAWT